MLLHASPVGIVATRPNARPPEVIPAARNRDLWARAPAMRTHFCGATFVAVAAQSGWFRRPRSQAYFLQLSRPG